MYRQGEVLLKRVDDIPKGKIKSAKSVIVAHSETGHHHVLESDVEFDIVGEVERYLDLKESAKLVHKKSVDRHNDITVAPGKYQIVHKTEYNPYLKVISRVQD